MIKAILWDNDGVLVDTEHLYFRATREILATVDIDLTPEMYIDLFLTQDRGAWHLPAERGHAPEAIAQMRDERDTRFAHYLDHEPLLIEGVEETLTQLGQTYQMGIVTSSRRDNFERIHRRTGLLKYFAFSLTSDDYEKYKPHPQPYLRGQARIGYPKEQCIVIEDSQRWLIAATRAGIKCLVIPNHMTHSSDFSQAHAVLESITQVPEALQKI